ncbi:MAG: zinc-binding dehydrogenase, partial [Alphaproteobacteria bacterium]|nr:zinc-binding dehydrogenase [Alphaproteobacteria bacterium]
GRFVGQSSFATYSLAPGRSVIKIDRDLPLELMGPLGCGLTTGFGTVINAIKPPAGSSIAIFGVGTVGLASVMGAVQTGCEQIIAIDMKPARLDMAAELGATHLIDASTSDPVAQIRAITRRGADFSVECSGAPKAVRQAVDCLNRPGWAAQVGATPGGIEIPFSMDDIGMGRGIMGVVMGDSAAQTFVPYLAHLWRDGRLPYDKFVRYYDFADINQAVHDSAVTGEVIKPILKME